MTTCPLCNKKAAVEVYRPFCSERCQQIDLGRWLNETYVIPVKPTDDEKDDIPSA